jgi:hypothetical protein
MFNVLGLSLGRARFESHPEHWLYVQTFCDFPHSLEADSKI